MSEVHVNSLKALAHQVLMKESFRYINQLTQDDYKELARMNAKLRGVTTNHFFYNGDIYPSHNLTTSPLAAPLHYSLYEEYDSIVKRANAAGTEDISNYFREVLSRSINGIVLDELLPTFLVNNLKEFFTETEYSLIDYGTFPIKPTWEPLMVTRQNIDAIKDHYARTISMVRELLMNKFLLQG